MKTFYYGHNDLRSGSMLPQMMKHQFYFESASKCRFSPLTFGRSSERTNQGTWNDADPNLFPVDSVTTSKCGPS